MRSLLVLAAILSAGCASGPEPRTPGSWGGIVEETPEPPPPMTGLLSVPTPSIKPYPTREFTAEEKEFLDVAWSAFKQGDRAWPEMQARWVAMGPEAVGVLAENLYRALVASRARGALHLVDVAKKELEYLGEGAVPVLIGAMAVRGVRMAEGGEVAVGQEVIHDAAEAASVIGGPAVPGLLDIAGCGEPSLVKEALWALGNIGDPRAEAALLRLASDPNSFVRAEAVLALRRYGSEPARARMVAALEDEDRLVVERAARALATGKHALSLPAVVDVLDRAAREGKVQVTRACVFVLQSLTDEKIGPDAAAWRKAIRER
jgi:hypothetical protein